MTNFVIFRLTVYVILFHKSCDTAGTFPSKETVAVWASNLNTAFEDLTTGENDITGATAYKMQFQASLKNDFKIKKPNGEQMLREYAEKINNIFDQNTKALKNLQLQAEEAIAAYEYNYGLVLPEVKPLYINVNNIDKENASHLFKYNKHFRQDVYDGQSGVQIPIEIYEGYPEILNGLKWSKALDEAFKKNKKDFPGIYWQSFGSQQGFTRFFPAARWRTYGEIPDLYDVRRRPWYIHGSVSPKDIVVLLDTSGSMHGQSFDIMKLAAKTLLNTLGENDFVNVAAFSSNVTWVTPCLDTLVQANSRNKRLLFDGIDKIEDHKIADYGEALSFAYDQLEMFSRETQDSTEGSNCHKLIMFFSDGGTDYPADVVAAFNETETGKNVRIFTYAVGPHPLPTVALKSMACNTGGSFSTITAMGAIRTKIQDYVRVLSKPFVLANTNADPKPISFSLDHMGLGMTTTLTLPVFNTSKHSDNQTLAGVVGVDIPVFKFENAAPRTQIGALGHSFAINPNGFLVFHPSLWMDSNFLQDPSHIDIDDIHGESDFVTQLRKAMIDSEVGEINSMVEEEPLDLETRIPMRGKRKYHFTKIGKDSFSLAIALDESLNYLELPTNVDLNALEALEPTQSVIAEWNYCGDDFRYNSLEDLIQRINSKECNDQSVLHLAWDAKNVKAVFSTLDSTTKLNNEEKVVSYFISTDGGLTMFSPESSAMDYNFGSNPHNTSMYRLAVSYQQPRIFIQRFMTDGIPIITKPKNYGKLVTDNEDISNPYDAEEPLFQTLKPALAYLTSPVVVNKDGLDYVAGVSGVQIDNSYLQKVLMEATTINRQIGQVVEELDCNNPNELICYLVNDNGYILSSNQNETLVETGDFLGSVDPLMMEQLVEGASVFIGNVDFNYQSLCKDDSECGSFGVRSVIIPTLNSLVYLIQNFFDIVWNMGYFLTSILSILTFNANNAEAVSEFGYPIPTGLHRCTSKSTTFSINSKLNQKELHSRLLSRCKNANFECMRDYHLYMLDSINAILVVADPKCENCIVDPYKAGPEEVLEFRESCTLPERYRKRPDECFATHSKEISECSSSSSQKTLNFGVMLMALSFMSLFAFTRRHQ